MENSKRVGRSLFWHLANLPSPEKGKLKYQCGKVFVLHQIFTVQVNV